MKVPVLTIMFLIMFGLKLAGIVTFSWWIVTSPIWAPIVFLLSMFLIGVLLAAFASK